MFVFLVVNHPIPPAPMDDGRDARMIGEAAAPRREQLVAVRLVRATFPRAPEAYNLRRRMLETFWHQACVRRPKLLICTVSCFCTALAYVMTMSLFVRDMLS